MLQEHLLFRKSENVYHFAYQKQWFYNQIFLKDNSGLQKAVKISFMRSNCTQITSLLVFSIKKFEFEKICLFMKRITVSS